MSRVADLMFADFLFEAAGQIAQAAKLRYMPMARRPRPWSSAWERGGTVAGPHH